MSRSKPDAGLWYYHAPEQTKSGMPKVNYPPPSQIPGLNGVPGDPQAVMEEERERNAKYYFKDTDSSYIRLAKLGGRKDLLVMPEKPATANPVKNKHSVTGGRCDWFYQLDNMAEDAAKAATEPKYEHKFKVPEYMVHHERAPRAPQNYQGAGHVPFATQNVMDSIDTRNPTDKTVRIKEPVKSGFGRRLAKQKETDVRGHYGYHPSNEHLAQTRAMHSAPQPPPRFEYSKPPPQTEGDVSMNKLLSYGYQRDWEEEQNKWWHENERRAVQFAEDHGIDPATHPRKIMIGNPSSGPGVTGSEYGQQYAQYQQHHM